MICRVSGIAAAPTVVTGKDYADNLPRLLRHKAASRIARQKTGDPLRGIVDRVKTHAGRCAP